MANAKNVSTPPPAAFGRGGRGMPRGKVRLKNPKQTLSRLMQYLGKYKRAFILVFFFSLATTALTIICTGITGDIIDKYIAKDIVNLDGLRDICLLLLGMYLTNALIMYVQNRIMVRVGQTTTLVIRKDLFAGLQRLPLRFFDSHSSGDLMSRLTNDVDNINMAMSQTVTQMMSGIITVVGMLTAMLVASWQLTLVGLATTPIMIVIMRSLVHFSQPVFVKQQRLLGGLNGYAEESISGQKATILFGRGDTTKAEFGSHNKAFTGTAILSNSVAGLMGPINNCIANIAYLIVCVAGASFTVRGIGGLTVGMIYPFIVYLKNFNRPINEFFNLLNTLQHALAGAERVFDVMDEPQERDAEGAVDLGDIRGEVELRDVHFGYDEDKEVLHGISLHAEPGSTVAIVGHTGAGKTTIINLLTKFYDISSGSIMIDGQDIRGITMRSLRDEISIVLQDTYLFSVSVKDNLRYTRPDATDEEVEAAAVLANAHNFIMQLPHGYDTVLADNGSDISQGQRQLLAIARAVLADARILILDEATSNIDTKTEQEIQRAMLNLMQGRTSFVIAHRLSTIQNADKIIMLSEGRIIEQGTHAELIAADGAYAALYNSQFSEGD